MTPEEFRASRPPAGRLDRRLRRDGRAPPGDARRAARRHHAAAPRPSADDARRLRRRARRRRPHRRARAGPLAAPELLRLLPGQQLLRRDPRRAAVGGARRQRVQLGDVAGVHRTGAARRRLDGRAARSPGALPQHERRRRWRDPGHGERGHAGRRALRPLASDGRSGQQRRRHVAARRLRHGADPLEHREGAAHRRHRYGRDPGRRARRGLRHAPRLARRRRSPPTAPPACGRSSCAPRAARRRRWRSIRRRTSPRSVRTPTPGCTSTRRWRASPPSIRSSVGSTTGCSSPTATARTRTSGWASTSTATCTGRQTASRSSAR